jgi:hypothetical protein
MSCGAIDIGCHVAAYFDPLLTFWGSVGAFIKSWWWVAYGAVCMAFGAHMGKARTYTIITGGLVALGIRYWPQKADEPDWETGESNMQEMHKSPPPKKKPKPILADTSIFEDFMTRLRKKK